MCVCGFFSTLLHCCDLSSLIQCLVPLPRVSQEGEDYEVIPNSKFFVSRTANKDNSSAYYIDGKKATFKDVGTLLRSHGIDLDHNRFLILQVINYILVHTLPICFTFKPAVFPPSRSVKLVCSGFAAPLETPFHLIKV